MRLRNASSFLSASDLANHLGCHHLTTLDRAAAEGRLAPPLWRDSAIDLLSHRGLVHEEAYLERVRVRGLRVTRLEGRRAM